MPGSQGSGPGLVGASAGRRQPQPRHQAHALGDPAGHVEAGRAVHFDRVQGVDPEVGRGRTRPCGRVLGLEPLWRTTSRLSRLTPGGTPAMAPVCLDTRGRDLLAMHVGRHMLTVEVNVVLRLMGTPWPDGGACSVTVRNH
jgi:hypothetical protein